MDDLLARSRKRFEELTKILQDAENARAEWRVLNDFLTLAENVEQRLDPNHAATGQADAGAALVSPTPRVTVVKRTENSAEIAESVLRAAGTDLHVKKIIELMMAHGWQGSGDQKKDYKNVHQLLSSRLDKFQGVGNRTARFRVRSR